MHRTRRSRWIAPALAPGLAGFVGLVGLAWLGLPHNAAQAAPPQRGGGFDEGGYIMGSPGSLGLPLGEDDFPDLDPTFSWSFGGGYMFARGPLFKATVGGVFEHSLIILDDFDFDDLGGHILRFMPEARIGAGTNKVWGYGLFGFGIAGAILIWDDDLPFIDNDRDESWPGATVQIGGGVQGIVWRNLFLGAELDFDFGFFFEDEDDFDINNDDDFAIHQVTIEFMIGWYF